MRRLVLFLLFAAGFCGALPVYGQPSTKLDNYLCYQIDPVSVGSQVYLSGIFDTTYKPVYVHNFYRFCNPVECNHNPIIDKHAHLSWYEFDPIGNPEPQREIKVTNKFGTHVMVIGQAFDLLVPTEKIECGSKFPAQLDHYKVYEILQGHTANKGVFLIDQFASQGNVAMRAVYFAVPVEKWHNGALFKINNPDDFLVFYTLDPISWNFQRSTKDQFGMKPMQTRFSELLGSASKLDAWREL